MNKDFFYGVIGDWAAKDPEGCLDIVRKHGTHSEITQALSFFPVSFAFGGKVTEIEATHMLAARLIRWARDGFVEEMNLDSLRSDIENSEIGETSRVLACMETKLFSVDVEEGRIPTLTKHLLPWFSENSARSWVEAASSRFKILETHLSRDDASTCSAIVRILYPLAAGEPRFDDCIASCWQDHPVMTSFLERVRLSGGDKREYSNRTGTPL